MTDHPTHTSPISILAENSPNQPAVTPDLDDLYRSMEKALLIPLWTEIGDLMPPEPRSKAVPHLWEWTTLLELAARAGHLVPVGRGGERRAIALANPGLGGRPYATPTLWAAIQYLMPGENAPEHRHSQHAFRFVVEGEGVWTVVNGDPVPMNRGDFLPQAGMAWHAHHNAADRPMSWIDGLDIPFQHYLETTFFDVGRDEIDAEERTTPERSRAQHLWAHPGIAPATQRAERSGSPLLAYRWADTDAALADQLAMERAGHPVTVERGHALVRFINPATGGDVLPTIRAQFHRVSAGIETLPRREVGSSVYAVFDGTGTVAADNQSWTVHRGDMFVVPSWSRLTIKSEASAADSDSGALDLFQFGDQPISEKLGLYRSRVEDGN